MRDAQLDEGLLDLEYHGHTIAMMPARKVAISLSSEALALVDRDAAREGISRSAWFERAAQREKRRQGIKRALSLARAAGVRAAADVLAEFWRETSLPKPARALIDHGIDWIEVTPVLAKRAGRALVDAGSGPSAVDALVATVAAAFGDTVLTSAPRDFARLAQHYRGLRVLAV